MPIIIDKFFCFKYFKYSQTGGVTFVFSSTVSTPHPCFYFKAVITGSYKEKPETAALAVTQQVVAR